jgi:hypothetical protein
MHNRIFGPELLIRTPVFLVQYNAETIEKGEAMWRRNWWRSNSRGRASGYGLQLLVRYQLHLRELGYEQLVAGGIAALHPLGRRSSLCDQFLE